MVKNLNNSNTVVPKKVLSLPDKEVCSNTTVKDKINFINPNNNQNYESSSRKPEPIISHIKKFEQPNLKNLEIKPFLPIKPNVKS